MARPKGSRTNDLAADVWPDRSVKDRRLTIRAPMWLLAKVEVRAEQDGKTKNRLVVELLADVLRAE